MSIAWIDLPTAAKRSGRSVGHLARLCRDKWQSGGAAEQRKPDKGKAEWFIREDADAAFASVKFPEQIGTDLRDFTAAQRKAAIKRLEILSNWNQARAGGVKLGFNEQQITAQFLQKLLIDEQIEVNRSTLFNWQKRYRAAGLAALVDQRGGKKEKKADPFLDEIKRFYLSLRKPKLTDCYQMALVAAHEQGWQTCSYRTAARFIDAIPAAVLTRYRFGEEAYTNEAEPYIERDYSTLRANEIWCGDHHQFDLIVRDGDKLLRPWLTAWQDLRSRKIVGWTLFANDPNTDTILQALVNAIHPCRGDHGVPESIYIDNGKDYDSFIFQGRTKFERRRFKLTLDPERIDGIFPALGITTCHAPPYHPQSKPIERFFGTLAQKVRVFETYCGNSPTDKPEDLQLQLERGKAPTLAEFREWFTAWLEDGYHHAAHSGDGLDGQTPAHVFATHLATKRTATPELLETLLLRKTRPVKVAQNGVLYNGIRYGATEPALFKRLGEEVCLRIDDHDLSHVQVYTPEDRFICLARANQKLPANASSEDLRAAMREKRQHRKLLNDYIDQRPRMHQDVSERLIHAAATRRRAEQQNAEPPPPPGAIKPVRSTVEEALPALQRARQNARGKIAVGAESFDPGRFTYTRPADADATEPAETSMSFRDFMPNPQPEEPS